MQEIGRLTIGRKDGESFLVGGNTLVTLRHVSMRHRRATLDILHAKERQSEQINTVENQVVHLLPDVELVLRFDSQHGRQVKVTVTAPKSVSIMRSELLNEQAKAAIGA